MEAHSAIQHRAELHHNTHLNKAWSVYTLIMRKIFEKLEYLTANLPGQKIITNSLHKDKSHQISL